MPRRKKQTHKKQKAKETEKPMIYIKKDTIIGLYHGAKWLYERLTGKQPTKPEPTKPMEEKEKPQKTGRDALPPFLRE